MKRTPMKRTPFTGPRKIIPFRSEKNKAKHKSRMALREKVLKNRPSCEACSAYAVYDDKPYWAIADSVDLHEIVLRSQGGDILDRSIIISICRACHNRVDDEPKVALLLGLWLHGYQYDTDHVMEARKSLESWSFGVPYKPFYVEGDEPWIT